METQQPQEERSRQQDDLSDALRFAGLGVFEKTPRWKLFLMKARQWSTVALLTFLQWFAGTAGVCTALWLLRLI